MQSFSYLIALLISIAGLAALDQRHKLALWYDTKRTIRVLALGTIFFVAWDLLGITLGIFFHGGSTYALPIRLLPEFPLEELVFLLLLNYTALLLYRGGNKIWPRI